MVIDTDVHIKPEVIIIFESAGVDAISEMGQVIEEINGLRSETNGINAMKDDLNQKLYATLKLIQKRLSSSSC
ncbi:unnamed protein product [Rhizophagus irregularis]|nr:unnamed protein product [Rhizophagus irregularis]CAB5145416.1 unnamed protein product [Rhizophagus irregularis]